MDTREAVQRRIELAARQDARIHGQYFEDTLMAFSELFGSEVAEEARGAVPGLNVMGTFNCPVADLLRLCDVGARAAALRADVPYAEALERIGALVCRGYLQSPLGKALWRLSCQDLHEVLSRTTASARASTTYGNRRYERLGPTSALLIMRGDLMGPAWVRGFYAHGLPRVSSRSVSVSVEDCREPGLDFNLRIDW